MTALEDLRASQDRDQRRVGIPMIVVLRDETVSEADAGPQAPTNPASSDRRVSADGERLARRLDQLRQDLAAGQRDGDMGLVASLLTVAAHSDFGAGIHLDAL